MNNQALAILKGGGLLLRSVAVVSSSVATIVSTVLPLYLYYPIALYRLISLFLLLTLGAFVIHGVLTHILNDYIDHQSGTDAHSPAILSGGSRVIQEGYFSSEALWRFGKSLFALLAMVVAMFVIFGYYQMAILLAIGLWGAVSYSLPPLRLSYLPLVGEWLATFPSVFFLGVAGGWLMLDPTPEWVLQNAVINALFCIAWVMIHHIPDRDADRKAVPTKKTSVVWSVERFGTAFSRLPALVYFGLTGLCALWLGLDRLWAAVGLVIMTGAAVFLIFKMDVEDHQQVSACEKAILILAMVNAVWLGIFI
ncbi:1,4-dihydroxy-2-naphthoate octaprenyltransferase [Thalassobacillus cyri]|uniref:1,4-dihydroxy-2-naphthoate octaprenyltransferase n=1 Tax=Thalassobacillus cyri TaxID=571932 RepID=A0A1H4A7B2_9BACI|nr:prenyltransferase [Thalassobacillus cyri]SEA31806.1 1,4-dihydroxy-2-naphthoate octaprenyltransferase [Thalassobacillus cyri]